MREWTFLTNHARALVCIARDPNTRIRDIAACAEITERAAHAIVTDLAEAGYVEKHRLGARNFYEINPDAPLRHPFDADVSVGELLRPLVQRRASQ
jgi:DNA-binding IclR family transcriptional regulator